MSGYTQTHTQRVLLGDQPVVLISKPGLPAWDESEAAARLITSAAQIVPGGRVLVLEGGAGALSVWAARQGGAVHHYDGSLIGTRLARLTAHSNNVDLAVHEAAFPAAWREPFEVALMLNPKGRAYTRLLLAAARRALVPGGRLYFAGSNDAGALAIAKDAGGVFEREAVTLANKARSRVCLVRRGPEPAPDDEPLPYHTFEVGGLTLLTLPGVFSGDGLDDGTAMLLDTLDPALCVGKRVLDVGCGSGALGLTAARAGASVDLVDVFWLALDCAQRGALANDLSGRCRVFASDLYSDTDGGYDLILSNPPFHSGHSVDTVAAHALIAGARDQLIPGGALRIVANRFLPYDRLLREVFGAVTTLREDGRFRVLESVKP